MSNQADSPLTRWVDEMQEVLKSITHLAEDNERHRMAAESVQRESGGLREEVTRLRSDAEEQRSQAEAARRERDGLRETLATLHAEVATLQAENERLRTEQSEAGETASKLLGEMKDLVNQVAHKFQGTSRTSPFSREPRPPQS